MKYLSIDIETTGLNPVEHSILQIAAVIGDTSILYTEAYDFPSKSWFVKLPQNPTWDNTAFKMHDESGLIDLHLYAVSQDQAYSLDTVDIFRELVDFTTQHNLVPRYTAAGKNFAGFDIQFLLNANPQWNDAFRHRVIDPAVLFFRPDDDKLPSLQECKERAGIYTPVAHDALEDAKDVAVVTNFAFQNLLKTA